MRPEVQIAMKLAHRAAPVLRGVAGNANKMIKGVGKSNLIGKFRSDLGGFKNLLRTKYGK